MKDFGQIWGRVAGRRFSGVNTELKEISNNRLQRGDFDTSTFESNLAECEGLNNKFEDFEFSERKDAIINRLFERRRKGQLTRQPKCLFLLLMLGFFALGAGCFILIAHPYDFLFKQKVVLQEGGEIFEMWKKPEVDLYVRIFLFNVTNAEDYMAGRAEKIIVKEVGPYVYKEDLEHKIIKFNDNGTISAIPRHPLSWVDELSEGNKEDDLLFLPNIALLSIADVVAKQSMLTRFGLNNLISIGNIQPLVQMTAKEFMMGYKSNLMTLGNTFMPGWISFDKLGLIDRMYDFKGDYETIYTGEADVRDSGLIDTYRGSKDLPQWQGSHCSNVQGASDGTKFRGGVTRNESLLFFRKSLCRAAPLIPVEEGVKSGLKAYMYTFPEHLFDNGKHIPENKCFCRNGNCLPEGLIDVTECYYGFPIALSYPHFYKGDDVLFDKVEGLSPNKELHETRFWIQPESGLPLDVSAKIQINMALGDISKITNADRFANLYLPMLWFDIRMYSLPKSLEDRFRIYLNVLPLVEQGALYVLFLSGSLLILLSIYRLAFKIMFKTFDGKKKQRNYIIASNQKDRAKKHENIYAPCEIALNDTESDNSDPQFDEERRPSFFKTHSDRLKELSHRLSDKVYDSVGSVKDRVTEIIHVQKVFDNRKNSLINKDESLTNDGFKSDSSGDERTGNYEAVRQSDSEDDYRYLEVLDDGSEFDEPVNTFHLKRGSQFKDLDAPKDDVMVQISD
ncbi:scavenger receptor class B member 1-like isoform X1 [Leguminivora glycinivorella]|uniref:scavenger receptor class B member 1-like isoform X1 n=1 Tax=Leguminivora glycinivorella TaxID=1035111 RepID=UPI00200E87DD|nr:scavenger receptor class B member 1-like isoform X1 [Leguminivora glycinivorella]